MLGNTDYLLLPPTPSLPRRTIFALPERKKTQLFTKIITMRSV